MYDSRGNPFPYRRRLSGGVEAGPPPLWRMQGFDVALEERPLFGVIVGTVVGVPSVHASGTTWSEVFRALRRQLAGLWHPRKHLSV